VRGVLIKRSLHQSLDYPVPSAKAVCKQRGEKEKKIVNREKKEKK